MLLSLKAWLESPEAWKEHFESAGQKSSPFLIQLIEPETKGILTLLDKIFFANGQNT